MPKSQLKFNPNFNLSSMTDIVFLLLIFFMLTSKAVTPSAVEVKLPTSKAGGAVMPKLTITISDEGKLYVNRKEVTLDQMEDELRIKMANSGERQVVLHTGGTTHIQKVVDVMNVGNRLGIDVQLAVKKE